MGYKMKGKPIIKGTDPHKKAIKTKKLDHIGKPYMRPPYKDTASGTRPYEKRQGYHGHKDFDSILSKDRPQPTWPGTDEYRKPEDIPEKEYEKRGIKKSPAKQPAADDLPEGYERGEKKDLKGGGTMTVIKKKEEKKKVYAPGETRIIKSGDKEYTYTPPKKKKSKRSKMKRKRRPKARKVKNLVTGGYNVIR